MKTNDIISKLKTEILDNKSKLSLKDFAQYCLDLYDQYDDKTVNKSILDSFSRIGERIGLNDFEDYILPLLTPTQSQKIILYRGGYGDQNYNVISVAKGKGGKALRFVMLKENRFSDAGFRKQYGHGIHDTKLCVVWADNDNFMGHIDEITIDNAKSLLNIVLGKSEIKNGRYVYHIDYSLPVSLWTDVMEEHDKKFGALGRKNALDNRTKQYKAIIDSKMYL